MAKYQLSMQNFYDESGDFYTTYGIKIIGSTGIRTIEDVSIDKKSVETLVERFNKLNLSEHHVDTAIEDFLYDLCTD